MYINNKASDDSVLNKLLNRLGELGCDFQMTFVREHPLKKMSYYSAQRQDIMAVVCSASEGLAEKFKGASRTFYLATGTRFPTVLFVGNTAMT